MKKLVSSLIVVAVTLTLLSGCGFPEKQYAEAKRALEDAGYTNVEITKMEAFGCGRDDTFNVGFNANTPGTGRRVHGNVCYGLVFKGLTIRVDP